MPECESCGNQRTFTHEVESREVRKHDQDTGEVIEIEKMSMESMCVQCTRCKSTQVTMDL